MATFEIVGGHKLSGEITPQGAKNEALQVISAVLLTAEPVTISNVPDIADVRRLINLLRMMGVKALEDEGEKGTWHFQADQVDMDRIDDKDVLNECAEFRGSVMTVGPLLTRFGHAWFPKPGGDKIGRRRVDTHLDGLSNLGAAVEPVEDQQAFRLTVKDRLKGRYMLLDEASVTGTANILMAAVLAKGKTVLYNAACEPYLQQLCKMLCKMGAKISGISSNLLTIEGVSSLHGATHKVQADMIEVGSFIGMAAMTDSEITIKNAGIQQLGIIPDVFRRLGIQMEYRGDDIFIPAQEHYEVQTFMDGSILTVADAPWPGFTPDLISIVLVVATQAKGTVLIHQKMFESRLFFVDKLIDMGAQIILCDPHRANVIGLDHHHALRGIRMASPDIRAGVALLIAALSADGTSIIDNSDQIERG